MKRLSSFLAATIFIGLTLPAARSAVSVSVDFFHDNLEAYGEWREVGDYGYCWQPREVDRDWRPYSDGRWLYTDAGWTWDSDEPYSWAVYHYGRWARIDQVGWVWVPGTEWGPAWVSWRSSPQHVGWAPLPPEAEFIRSAGFSARVDADYDIGPTNYSFVAVRDFGAPRLRTVIVEPRENITIIRQTTNITRITYVNNVIYNQGPQYDAISRQSAQPIRRLKLERRAQLDGDPRTVRAEQLRSSVAGDSLRVVALPFDSKPGTAPRKVAARVEKTGVDRGWKNAGSPAEVAELRTKIKSEPATPPVSSVPLAVPGKKPAKGKVSSGSQPTRPTAPVTPETPIVSPEAPVVPDKPLKSAQAAKPVSPAVNRPAASLPNAERPEQPPVKKGKSKGSEATRLPAQAVPQAQVPKPKPTTEDVKPMRKLPPTAVAPAAPKINRVKEDARPEPAPAAAQSIQRTVPNKPEPRPQAKQPAARPQAAPAAKQPQPAKGKPKSKDDKKDAEKQ